MKYTSSNLKPTFDEVYRAIGILENFSLFSRFGENMLKSLKSISAQVEVEKHLSKKQALITDFFKD